MALGRSPHTAQHPRRGRSSHLCQQVVRQRLGFFKPLQNLVKILSFLGRKREQEPAPPGGEHGDTHRGGTAPLLAAPSTGSRTGAIGASCWWPEQGPTAVHPADRCLGPSCPDRNHQWPLESGFWARWGAAETPGACLECRLLPGKRGQVCLPPGEAEPTLGPGQPPWTDRLQLRFVSPLTDSPGPKTSQNLRIYSNPNLPINHVNAIHHPSSESLTHKSSPQGPRNNSRGPTCIPSLQSTRGLLNGNPS